MLEILVPVSLGELVDKITILRIKCSKLSGSSLRNVQKELSALERVRDSLPVDLDDQLVERLALLNKQLWEIEDALREKERIGLFDAEFVRLARCVYQKNDERARMKRVLNERYGSLIVEEKSYDAYRHDT